MATDVRRRHPREMRFTLETIGFVRSSLVRRELAPRQGDEGGARARLELGASVHDGLRGIVPGDELVVLTWLHQAQRDVLLTHPRNELDRPLTGVFATRSPDRPNPIGLHRVRVLAVADGALEVEPLEAIDGTPIVDIKPVLAALDH